MSRLLKLYESYFDSDELPTGEKRHSMHCVCKGKNWIWQKTHGTTGLNGSTPISGNKKVPCPYGDLRVNDIHPAADGSDEEDWDL